MAIADLADDRFGDPGEDIVDRIADMAVPEADAIGGSDKLNPLTTGEGLIHLLDRGARRCFLVGDGMSDVAQRRPGANEAVEDGGLVGRAASEPGDRRRVWHDTGIREPVRRRFE